MKAEIMEEFPASLLFFDCFSLHIWKKEYNPKGKRKQGGDLIDERFD